MRPSRVLGFFASLLLVPGCLVYEEVETEPLPSPSPGVSIMPGTPAGPPPSKTTTSAPVVTPSDTDSEGAFAEVVHVYMRAKDRSSWMCTGTLVGPRTVVTDAHCLDPALFVSYQIVAANAPGSPRVAASSPRIFLAERGSFEDVANPDIGALTLASPVVVPRYAVLTDVVDRVEAGEPLQVASVVRTSEEAEAPFVATSAMPLSSTVQFGYAHGFATPMFSKGGDSGAGFFLVENGKRTHKLVGVARNPEPARKLDHMTRIDAAFLAFLGAPK